MQSYDRERRQCERVCGVSGWDVTTITRREEDRELFKATCRMRRELAKVEAGRQMKERKETWHHEKAIKACGWGAHVQRKHERLQEHRARIEEILQRRQK